MIDLTDQDSARSSRVDLAQTFLRHVGHRDASNVLALLSEDVNYRVAGHSPLSGTFHGRQAVATHMCDVADRTLETMDPVKWEDWLIGEQHVAALVRVHANPSGKVYVGRNLYLLRFDVEDLIDEVLIFFEDEDAASRTLGR